MPDPISDVVSVRTIAHNIDYLINWLTTVITALSFAALISIKDKLTGAAVLLTYMAAGILGATGWPLLLQYGYGSLGTSLIYGAICGLSGITILMTLIGVIQRIYRRRDAIGDAALNKVGVPPLTPEQNP